MTQRSGPDPSGETEVGTIEPLDLDDRGNFYRRLKRLRRGSSEPGEIRLAIALYEGPQGPLRMVGEWTGDRLYLAIKEQILINFNDRGDWYRIGRARLGFLSTDFESDEMFVDFLNRFVDSFREPVTVGAVDVDLQMSIGATHDIHTLDDLDELLFEVEASATLASEKAWSSYEFFYGESDAKEGNRLNVIKELYPALENDEFLLHYQPVVSMDSGDLVGAEVLVRWDHPELGLIYPGSFIPEAEKSGLITFLGSWVLEEGIRQIAGWKDWFDEDFQIAINLSPKQFRDPNLAEKIQTNLAGEGVDPTRLILEITEEAVLEDREQARGQLSELIDVGVRIALDDFGTGYSTLSQLADLPIHVIKLDRSFIANVPPTRKERSVVEIIINACKTMGLVLLCEGIETVSQWEWMQEEGCDLAQGFLIAPGIPADVFADWAKEYEGLEQSGTQPPEFPKRSLIRRFLPARLQQEAPNHQP